MKHRPYKLLNASELSAIGKRIESAWSEWAAAWLSGDGASDIHCLRAADSDAAAFADVADWLRLDAGDGQWWGLHCASAFRAQLGAALIPFGADASPGGQVSALLADLVKTALTDFLQRLAGSPGALVRKADSPDAQAWDAGSGAVVAKICWSGQTLTVTASAGLTAAMLAGFHAAPMRKTDLARPAEALANAHLKLNVLVGEAQLELALLQTIAVGDVIKLDARIDEPLQVVNAEGVRLCGAFLGSSQGRKSIQLTKLKAG